MTEEQIHIPLREAALNVDTNRGVIWLNTRTHCLLRLCNIDKELLKKQIEHSRKVGFGRISIDLRMK